MLNLQFLVTSRGVRDFISVLSSVCSSSTVVKMAKIKSKCLSLHEKTKLLEDYQKGLTVTALSRKYGVAKSTVCSIKNKKKKIIEAVAHSSTRNKKRTLRKAEFPKMERALYRWFLKQREKNVPITADILRQKALFFHEKFNQGMGNFNASYGWLQRFKKRFDFRYLKITGEKLSSAPELVDPFKELLKLKIEEFDLNQHQIYNADETGLFWKLLPEKTYVSLNEKTAPGLKMAKQRITFLGCTNAAGSHNLKPLIIGKSKQPRCFKNFNNPVIYRGNKSAWMTLEIFKEWFFKHVVTEVCTINFLKTFLHILNFMVPIFRLELFSKIEISLSMQFCFLTMRPLILQRKN